MGWKATGQPTVRRQRDKWVVRLDGIDTESGRHRPRQLGTYPSQRAARTAAATFAAERAEGGGKGTVGWLVDRWVAAKTDITEKSQMQNRWAAGHIRRALGAIRLDQLDRDDIARWYDELANGGVLNKRSITIIRRVLRAALEDALDEGLIRRNPAARVPVPKRVVKPERPREVDAWEDDQIRRFLTAIQGHRWEGPIRLATLYGLRRSELLALKWDDIDAEAHTVRIDEALIEVEGRPVWTEGKNERSRRTFGIDADTAERLAAHRRLQLEERMLAGPDWDEQDLVLATRTGNRVSPGNFDQTLDRLVRQAGVPRLTSHGLRHTAATHMVRQARDLGELRAVADVLGHSPDMLMRTYAHALPDSLRAVSDRIGDRVSGWSGAEN
jgi:integrase